MKKTLAIAILALFTLSDTQAIQLRAEYVDDIVKALAEDEKIDENKPDDKAAKKLEVQNLAAKKVDNKKKEKKEDIEDEVPMDNQAIKAYSSVIADAAEDSEPAHPVIYTEVMEDDKHEGRLSHAPTY